MTPSQDFSFRRTQITSWRTFGSVWESLDWNCILTKRAGLSSVGLPNKTGNEEVKASRKRSTFWVSVVQGYFNYYAVPGNLTSLGVFRDRVLALWWRTIRRRSQKRPISWTRILVLAQRWIPQPRALHPFPDARFAASHPR